MADQQQLAILRQGAAVWNKWREQNPDLIPDLSNSEIRGVDLRGCNLSDTKLSRANLTSARLSGANLSGADLSTADLSGADLVSADLTGVHANAANLAGADLSFAEFLNGDVSRGDFTRADLDGVKTEIANARAREEQQKRQMLFPITLAPFDRIKEWKLFDVDRGIDSAREIREYFIPDFSNWKAHDSYQQAFERLLRDLKAGTADEAGA